MIASKDIGWVGETGRGGPDTQYLIFTASIPYFIESRDNLRTSVDPQSSKAWDTEFDCPADWRVDDSLSENPYLEPPGGGASGSVPLVLSGA